MDLRVMLVEDDARYRGSIEMLLAYAPGFSLAAAFGDAESALAWARGADQASYDVALLDVELPRMSGIEAARGLKALHPRGAVVMLTVFEEPRTILQAICAGADGYLLKKTSARELLAQVRSIAEGGTPLTAGVARSVLVLLRALGPAGAGPFTGRLDLTEREQDVLRCLVRGRSYKLAAEDLEVSIDTVRSHVRSLYHKLQVHSVAEAVTRAIREGLV